MAIRDPDTLIWFGQNRASDPFPQQPARWPASPTGRGALPEEVASYRDFRGRERRTTTVVRGG
jgi:hypothetical protein